MSYELLNLSNLPICMGRPKIQAKEKGYPAEIWSFGESEQTGEHTSLEFSMPLSYAGETEIDGEIFDLFRIPDCGLEGKDLFNAEEPLYLMLGLMDDVCKDKWLCIRPNDNKVHTVKKIFNKNRGKMR